MNGNPHDQHEKQHETPDRRHEQSEPVEKTGTPDAVEAAHVRRDGDLLIAAKVVIAVVNRNGRPRRLPEGLAARFLG